MKKAVLDIGTNSVRLYVALIEGGRQKRLHKALNTTRLGEGIGQKNFIQKEPMARTISAVSRFVQAARNLGAEEIFIYATAMVREAENKEEFCQGVFEACGILPEVISGEIEAEIAYLGAAADYPGAAVLDIGGGSTEVVACLEDRLSAVSKKMGAVRLKERFPSVDGRIDLAPVQAYLQDFAAGYEETGVRLAKRLIGVSGTPTTLASLALGRRAYCPEVIQGYVLHKEEICTQVSALADMTLPERIEYMGEFSERADIIVYGGCILLSVMDFYNFQEITVSDRDSLEGFWEYKLKR